MELGYRSPKTLSRFALTGVALVGLCALLAAFVGIAQIAIPNQVVELSDSDSMSLWLILQGVVALIHVPVYVFAVVMFLVWLHRTYTNLPALQSDNTEFSPGWAVGWWFIPLANLVKPFQAVRNVWAESDPQFDPEMGFLSSIQSGAPVFMGVWWGFWLLSNFVSNITGRVYDPEDIRTVEVSGYLFIVSGILWVTATVLVIKIIIDITERQEMRFRNIGLLRQHVPPPPPTFDSSE